MYGKAATAENEEQTALKSADIGDMKKCEAAAISRAGLLISHFFMSPMSALFKAILDARSYTKTETPHEHVNVATTCFMDTASYKEAAAAVEGFNDDDALLLAEGAAVSRLLTLLSDKDAFNRDVISFANGTMKDSFMPIVYVAAIMRYYVSTTST